MWFNRPVQERIQAWRDWRLMLAEQSLDSAMSEIADVWSQVSLSSHYLHPELPDEWPNPWQLIHDNIYCELAIALGMCYTVSLLDHSKVSDITIEIYDTGSGWLNLSSVNQGKYVLNYNVGSIVNIEQVKLDGFKMICRHSNFDF
jgi:hypothetical protein